MRIYEGHHCCVDTGLATNAVDFMGEKGFHSDQNLSLDVVQANQARLEVSLEEQEIAAFQREVLLFLAERCPDKVWSYIWIRISREGGML